MILWYNRVSEITRYMRAAGWNLYRYIVRKGKVCMETITWSEKIPIADSFDIIVAGGGISGVAAALSGARQGCRVLLLEKNCSLGGLATAGLVNFWVPFCNGRGRMVIRGMAEELLRLSVKYGFDTFPPDWKGGEPAHATLQRCESWFSAGLFSLSLLKLLREEKVCVLYDALVSAPVMENNRCLGVIIDGKSGRRFYACKALVDATGDAAVLKMAGVPVIDGSDYFTYYGEGITLEGCRRAVEKNDIFQAYYHPYGGAANLHGVGQPEDVPLLKGVDMDAVNEYIQKNQLLMLEKEKDKPRMERNIHMLPGMAQLRTARRIEGDVTLTGEDCYRHFDTSIGTVCDFEYRDRLYEIPYGTLVREGFGNLITCGRSVSASGWGWDVLRVIPPAVLTGQAAGIAAAHALQTDTAIWQLPVAPLQRELEKTGVRIHFPAEWVPKGEAADSLAAPADHI